MWDLLSEISENVVYLILTLTVDKSDWSCFVLQGDQIGIAPRMFKALIGRGHPEFSTNRQQDAQEFLLHFINMVEVKSHSNSASLFGPQLFSYNINYFRPQRNCRSGSNPSEAFRFLVEERIVCQQSQKAKYTQRVDYIVQLPVPMDQATNTGEGLTGYNVQLILQFYTWSAVWVVLNVGCRAQCRGHSVV